jgi:Ca-activated chloride channel family protein
MTFATPLALGGLLAVPVLVVWYVRRQRGRARDRAAFVLPALMPSVAPERPGWRRHLPMLAFAAAVTVLIVALAGPQATRAVPMKSSTIMLVVDNSSSMAATDVAPSRLLAVQRAARQFLKTVPSSVAVGVIVFNQTPTVLTPPTTDHAVLQRALTGWHADGHTAIGDAMAAGLRLLTRTPKATRPPAAMVVLSDGTSTNGANPITVAQEAAGQHIRVDTVALGTPNGTINVPGPHGTKVAKPVPPDPQSLAQIAHASGGQSYAVQDASRLDSLYAQLGAKLSHHHVKQHIANEFAGGALVLLLLGSGLSLRWFGRLI